MRNHIIKTVLPILLLSQTTFARIEISSDRELSQVSEVRQEFESSLELHRQKKMGIGIQSGGITGLASIMLQMNFALDVGVNLGYGFGRGFNTFSTGFRQLLATGSVAPYWGVSYARVMGRGDNFEDGSSPKVLSEKFLSGKERRSGIFTENIIYPSLGLQIYKMSGDWAGAAVFAEINYLIDMEDFVAGAAGTLGFVQYF